MSGVGQDGVLDEAISADVTTEFQFSPISTLARMFTATPETRMIFVLGPVGSSKTTHILYWLLLRAASQEPSPDGIRRTRFALVRNTLVQLKATVLKDIQSLFGPIIDWRPSTNVIYIRVADIESEWIMLGLENEDDERRLLSLQLTGVYINEVREILFPTIFAAFSRTGRFPSPMHGQVKCTYRFLIADTNMGVEGSELYTFLEEKRPPQVMYIHQPSALSPQADWLHFLPENYYQDLMIGATKAWVDTHVRAKWSHDLSGEPVFGAIFNEDFHVAADRVRIIDSAPLLVGIDPGLNPACVIGQMSARGQVRLLAELYAENMLFGTFVDEIVTPRLQMPGFAGKPAYFSMDPAGVNRSAVSGLSPKGLLESRGYDVSLATTNDIEPRLTAIESYLTGVRPPDDYVVYTAGVERAAIGPALLIDRSCPVLIEGLRSKYRYKRSKTTQQLDPKPEKKHPISDVVDAAGYLLMGITGTARFRRKADHLGHRTAPSLPPPPPSSAWT